MGMRTISAISLANIIAREKKKEYLREYYKKNKEQLSEKHKSYYQEHKEELKAYQKRYYREKVCGG